MWGDVAIPMGGTLTASHDGIATYGDVWRSSGVDHCRLNLIRGSRIVPEVFVVDGVLTALGKYGGRVAGVCPGGLAGVAEALRRAALCAGVGQSVALALEAVS